MSAAARALQLLAVLLLVGAAVWWVSTMNPSGKDEPVDKAGPGIGATDPQRFPWVLEECTRPPYYAWRFVARYPSEPICEKWKRQRQKETGRLHRCRLDDRAGGGPCG